MNFFQFFTQIINQLILLFDLELEDLERNRRDLDIFEPAIVVPSSVFNPDVVIPTEEPTIETDEIEAATTVNVNVYSTPFCISGFLPAPAMVKDIMLICLLVTNFLFFLSSCNRCLIRRRNRNLMNLNRPINRHIEHTGKLK